MHDPMIMFKPDQRGEVVDFDLDATVLDLGGKPMDTAISNVILNSLQDFSNNLGVENQMMTDVTSNIDTEAFGGGLGGPGGDMMHSALGQQVIIFIYEETQTALLLHGYKIIFQIQVKLRNPYSLC